MSIGLDLDWAGLDYYEFCWFWIGFGLQNAPKIYDQDRFPTELMEKNCIIFVNKMLYFFHFLDIVWSWI